MVAYQALNAYNYQLIHELLIDMHSHTTLL